MDYRDASEAGVPWWPVGNPRDGGFSGVLDGKPLYSAVLPPSGLAGDGPSETYVKFLVPAGHHALEARLRDSKREEGYDYEKVADIDLVPHQSLAVDFKADQGGFLLR